MEQDILGTIHHKGSHSKSKTTLSKTFLILVVFLVVMGVSFYGGVDFQRHHQITSSLASNNSSGQYSGHGGFGGGGQYSGDRVVGQVTAVSSTSISVQSRRTGMTDDLAITSTTQISYNGQSVGVSDIQTGDTVFVTEDSSNTSQAASILVNPSFGGYGGGSSPSGSGSTPDAVTN